MRRSFWRFCGVHTPNPADATSAPDPDVRKFTLPIDPVQAARYAYAATDENPVYFDESAALAAGYDGVIAPPTFVSSMLDYSAGPPESGLKPDGVAQDCFPAIVRPDSQIMGGGQDIEFVRPIRPGDVVQVTRTVVAHHSRPSARFGELEFVVVESQVVRQDGALVMRIVDTFIVKQ
jgi:acyl dehydratase